MKKTIFLLAALVVLALAASVYVQNDGAEHATATLKKPDSQVIEFARFTEDATGIVHVNIHMKGLSSGLPGTHFYAIDTCGGCHHVDSPSGGAVVALRDADYSGSQPYNPPLARCRIESFDDSLLCS